MKKQTQEDMMDIMLRDAFKEKLLSSGSMFFTGEELREENIPPAQFSPEFERKMEKLIRRARRMEWWKQNRTIVKQTAAMFAVVIALGVLLVTQADAFRVPFLELLYTTRDEFTEINVGTEDQMPHVSKKFSEFLPTYVMGGFQLDLVEENEGVLSCAYKNEDGEYYSVSFFESSLGGAVDTEDAQATEIKIKGFPGFITEKDGRTTILWYPEGYQYVIEGTISTQEMLHIIDSVKKDF